MKKFLSFDVGQVYTGVATNSDSLAYPLGTIRVNNLDELLPKIKRYVEEHKPESVIFGLPERGIIQKLVLEIVTELSDENIKSVIVNEDSSTKMAQKAMIDQGLSAIKRKKKEHQVVAATLLQEYLDGLLINS